MQRSRRIAGRRRPLRRGERGLFAADWLLVIAAVLGLGGLSAYLVEDYLEELTVERTAQQRDTAAYLEGGRQLNEDHRAVRHAAASAERIVEEALAADPDDPRFRTWADWARHFDSRCRRLPLSYSFLDDFAVQSLFLPPLRKEKKPTEADYKADPTGATDPLDADYLHSDLAEADTTPYPNPSIDPLHDPDKASTVYLGFLANRKIILIPQGSLPKIQIKEKTIEKSQELQDNLHKGAVAWCYLPRSISSSLADGTLDDSNLRVNALKAYASGVADNAKTDDFKNPGDKALPGTWQNWERYWTAKCLRLTEIFSDLKGFTVEANFKRHSGVPPPPHDELIYDPQRGGSLQRQYPRQILDKETTAECTAAPANAS